ncbi:MAG TPA: hypothetical protein VMW56_06895 [Candidatus Margulisiibacteriota bacterium]|nr:hypothetical protein [Candidatus Margulisiibacteriota bacterium]
MTTCAARARVCPHAALATLLMLSAFVATTAHAALSDADKKSVAEMALQWAIDGGIGDFKLVKDPAHLVVATLNLPKGVKLELPGRAIDLFSLLRIQAEADHGGDFLYFRFNRLDGDQEHAKVAIALVWAVGQHSKTQYLSGGGATLDLEKRDGKWQLLPVMNRWQS